MDPVQAPSPLNVPAEVLATLVEIGEEINSSLDLDEVLRKTAALVKRLIDYEIFSVLLVDESMHRLYHRFTIGYGEEAGKDWVIPIGQGITGTAAATGRAVRVPDVREDPRYINIIDSVRSEMVIPAHGEGASDRRARHPEHASRLLHARSAKRFDVDGQPFGHRHRKRAAL